MSSAILSNPFTLRFKKGNRLKMQLLAQTQDNRKCKNKMDFVDLIKLIHNSVVKSSKWSEEDISKVLVKCKKVHELNELLLFCTYEKYNFNTRGRVT